MIVGIGFDIHRFEDGDVVFLGGVYIPFDRSLKGHSDADVLLHAICDALLGAAGEGDIGAHFPDTDQSFSGISSIELLKRTNEIISRRGFTITNIDSVIIAEAPRISPYRDAMIKNIATALNIETNQIHIKATTCEGLGTVGRKEGIAAYAVCLLAEK